MGVEEGRGGKEAGTNLAPEEVLGWRREFLVNFISYILHEPIKTFAVVTLLVG